MAQSTAPALDWQIYFLLLMVSKGFYLDHDTAAAHHLAGFAFTVDLAQTDPLAELLVVVNLEHKLDGVNVSN